MGGTTGSPSLQPNSKHASIGSSVSISIVKPHRLCAGTSYSGTAPSIDRDLTESDILRSCEPGAEVHFHHIHIKSTDPRASADWWAQAVGIAIESDEIRPEGDRFIRCVTENGVAIFISEPRPDEHLAAATPGAGLGMEHIGFHSDDLGADIDRLVAVGATLVSGPEQLANGKTIAFLHTPDRVRVELIQPNTFS